MLILGYSGLMNALAYKRKAMADLSASEYRLAQGFDAAAVLLKDGEIIAGAEEERFNGIKHTCEFPQHAIKYCLDQAGISFSDIDFICHGFNYEEYKSYFNNDDYNKKYYSKALAPQNQIALIQNLWPEESLTDRFIPIEHHDAHAASAFYPSGMSDALVVVCDGLGEINSTSIYYGSNNNLTLLKRYNLFSSIGILYSILTLHLGFSPCEDEYKVMGLASYGDPHKFAKLFEQCLQLKEKGEVFISGFLKNKTFLEVQTYRGFRKWLSDNGAPARASSDPITQVHKDFAAALQATITSALMHMLNHWRQKTGLTNLCYAGGVALNSTANGVIYRSQLFDDMFIQPAAGDAGTALGAALHKYYNSQPNLKMREPKQLPFFGPAFNYQQQNMDTLLKQHNIHKLSLKEDEVIAKTVDLLKAGKIIGWVQGRMEFGPRALGNRSILADPRNPTMQGKVNKIIKKRESFRPFAPSVKLESAHQFFDIPQTASFPYMLFTVPVKTEHQAQLPAITHVNGTARIQTVNKDEHVKYWRLLDTFGQATGYPILLNTSFNVKGQPIVCTEVEAIQTFCDIELDALIVDNTLYYKDHINLSDLQSHENIHNEPNPIDTITSDNTFAVNELALTAEDDVSEHLNLELKISAIWEELLELNHVIDINDDFFEIGGHSLLVMQLKACLDREFNQEILIEDLYQHTTIAELVEYYVSENSSSAPSPLITLNDGGDETPLFLIHPVGGEVFCFNQLAKRMCERRKIYGLHDPSNQSNKLNYASLEEMAKHYLEAMQSAQAHGPYQICGYSFGSPAAFEICRQLLEMGETISFFGVLDGWCKPIEEHLHKAKFKTFMQEKFPQDGNHANLLQLAWERFQLFLNYDLHSLDVDMVLLKAQETKYQNYSELNDPFYHWQQYICQPIRKIEVPGDHDSMLLAPHVTTLAQTLDTLLEEVQQNLESTQQAFA